MDSTRKIQHLEVPHDFSETADHALSYALDLAKQLGARVTIMHAYEVPAYAYPEGVVLTVEMTAEIQQAAQSALDRIVERVRAAGVEVVGVLRQGPAWSEIDAVARETHADLIVIGSHGRRGFVRALLGSVAEKVVRTASCPVLTVHAAGKH